MAGGTDRLESRVPLAAEAFSRAFLRSYGTTPADSTLGGRHGIDRLTSDELWFRGSASSVSQDPGKAQAVH